jgi:hypothetical protein
MWPHFDRRRNTSTILCQSIVLVDDGASNQTDSCKYSKCMRVSVEVSRATMSADYRAFPPPGLMVCKMLTPKENKKGGPSLNLILAIAVG